MTLTWKIETQVIPEFFDKNRGNFLELMFIYGTNYFCDIFNAAFEMNFDKKELKKPIKYKSSEFDVSVQPINDTDKVLCIELPKPRACDFNYDLYVKYYFIPYRVKKCGIEIYDLFGIDVIKNVDAGFIIWYKDSQHMMSNLKLPVSVNDTEGIIKFMSKYIFEKYN